MSSILKALQKLEKEKATRETREPDISEAITRESQRRHPVKTRWLVPVAMGVVALISILVTFAIMGGFSFHPQPGQPVKVVPPPAQPSPAQQPAQAASKSSFPAPQKGTASPPVARTTVAPLPSGIDRRKTPAVTAVPSPMQPVKATSSAQPPSVIQQLPALPAPAEQATEKPMIAQRPPTLKVSGIAWQKDSASRLAVINGISASEGSSIEGVKVEEIFPDKVRFSQGGKTFDVPLGQDNRH